MSPVVTTDRKSLQAQLAQAVQPAEVAEAWTTWWQEAGNSKPIGLYLAGRDGSHHLEKAFGHAPGAPAQLHLSMGPTEPGTKAVAFEFRGRAFGAVLLEADAEVEGLDSMLEEQLAPSLFRSLYLEDTVNENQRMRQQLYYLDEMGKLIGQLDLEMLLVNILSLTSTHLGADIGSMVLSRPEGPVTAVDWGLPHDALANLRHHGGVNVLDQALSSRAPILLHADELDPSEAGAYNFDTLLLLPLCTNDAIWGTINLVAPSHVSDLSSSSLNSIRSGVGLAATAVENALLLEIKLAAEREQEQLKVGQQIQGALLPTEAPKIKGLDLSGSSVPATMIGGDYYDYFELPDGRIGLAVADVAGKGVPAGLIMTATRALFRASASRHSDPPVILEEVNRLLCAEGFGSRFVTALFMALDPETGRAAYASAGHDAPMLWRAKTGQVEDHPMPALPLGLRPAAHYEGLAIELEVGDAMVLYTDGVSEAMDKDRDQYGPERLQAALKRVGSKSADTIRDEIVNSVDQHRGAAPRHDDTTLIVVRKT